MRVLVCGGRGYENASVVNRVLDSIHKNFKIVSIIHGGAKGADFLGCQWAVDLNRQLEDSGRESEMLCIEEFPADWELHGKSAGPIRNRQMLVEGRPDLVVAFPGGKGTANMIDQAVRAKVNTLVIDHPQLSALIITNKLTGKTKKFTLSR